MSTNSNLFEEFDRVLCAAGYITRKTERTHETLYFEDDTIAGQIVLFPTVSSLLDTWISEQDTFLRNSVIQLRSTTQKAWNLYSIFVTEDVLGDIPQTVHGIEEDFRGTRKIVGTAIKSSTDVINLLLPILPLQSPVKLDQADVKSQVLERIASAVGLPISALEKPNALTLAKLLLERE